MALKWLGVLLVFFGCAGTGYEKSEKFSERLRTMEDIRLLVWKIEGEIRVSGIPLAQVFLQVSRHIAEPWAEMLTELSRRMDGQESESFSELWAAECRKRSQGVCRPEDTETLLDLGKSLGYLDLHMQLTLLDGFLDDWGRRIEECRQEKKEKQKVYRCLGFAAGIFLTLLLV